MAFRSTARILPIAIESFQKASSADGPDLSPLPYFGAVLSSGVAAIFPTAEISESAYSAATAVFDIHSENSSISVAAAAASNAIHATAHAAHASYKSDAVYAVYAADAADAVSEAADVEDFQADMWAFLRADLDDERSLQLPLWSLEVEPDRILQVWGDASKALLSDSLADWTFWIAWYERVLKGRDWHVEAIRKSLIPITKEDWNRGPAHINPMFDEVLALYRAEDVDDLIDATPIGEDIVIEDGALTQKPKDQIKQGYLENVLEQLSGAKRLFAGEQRQTNSVHPLSEELELLDDTLTVHKDRPVLILKDVTRIIKRLAIKIETGVCATPDKDANIADFQGVMTDVQLDLIGLSPEVREWHEATRPPVIEEDAPEIAAGAQEVSAFADSAFATALTEAAATLLDGTIDADSRRMAQYWIVGAVTRSYKAVKGVVDETADVSKKVGTITATSAWLLSPAFRDWVEVVLRSFL